MSSPSSPSSIAGSKRPRNDSPSTLPVIETGSDGGKSATRTPGEDSTPAIAQQSNTAALAGKIAVVTGDAGFHRMKF